MLKTQSRKGSKKDENPVEKRQQIRTKTEWRKGSKKDEKAVKKDENTVEKEQ